ncbi:VOC family protein [Microbacterium sp. 18062]|uniref:VOC family protein n=1 Tax=Microbacterium sp. 18062 TaxID=2681410 RepID=UPI00135C82E6|nr:VOC family protein [Microbacterium sp. 18062]
MDVLSSRILLRPTDLERTRAFYRDVLGLGVYREFGPAEAPGTVFFVGNGLLEVSGRADAAASTSLALWMQVRDVAVEYARVVSAGAVSRREPRVEPWGLIEAHIADPDGVLIHLVQIPEGHPLRRDQR